MVIASRRRLRPRAVSEKGSPLAQAMVWAFLGIIVVAWGESFCNAPVTWLIVIALAAAWIAHSTRKATRHLNQLRASRPGESICTFVRRCEYRNVDLIALRAVYEELIEHMDGIATPFPIRPSDRLECDLLIDPEDLEDMAVVIAARAGRSFENPKTNPFYAKVETPFDLIRFLSHQPKLQ